MKPPLETTKTLLVVAAHPDDEVLGCGATVAKLVRQGWQAALIVMTGGIGGRHSNVSDTNETVKVEQAKLRTQAEQAAEVLGFAQTHYLDFPDNRMDTVSRADLALAIRPLVESIQPSLVLTHHPGDYNWDHTQVFEAVMMACRRNIDPDGQPEFSPTEIRTFEVLSSTERAWQSPERAFHPNCYVDVEKTIDLKKRALRCYTSEYRPYPHPRSIEAVEYLARKRGNEVGLPYAEAFHIVRRVEG